jgi:hypothetical protein
MDRRQFLIGHKTAETKNLGLLLAGLAADMRVDSIQTLAGPFGMNFCKDSGEKPFEASQGVPEVRRIVNDCPGRQFSKYCP